MKADDWKSVLIGLILAGAWGIIVLLFASALRAWAYSKIRRRSGR
jgi:ABC-type uncharacterized transport system permease subunit